MSIGRAGEKIAAQFLLSKGYKILTQNFRHSKLGEIDIVAEKKGVLIFCEVKTRKDKKFGQPFEAVTLKKQKTIKKIAQIYLQKHGRRGKDIRFDVISLILSLDDNPEELIHIENAFS